MQFKDEQNHLYSIYWTDNIESRIVEDFIKVCNKVFGMGTMSNERFNRKYFQNIYGPSLIIVVYDSRKEPIGARSFWRNDINGNIAYQPGDTCIVEKARGKGIFGKMTKLALEQIHFDAIIYNYPNDNSLNGYLNMGWKIEGEYRLKLLISKSILKELFVDPIDDDYMNWWLINNEFGNKCYFKYNKNNYLVVRKKNYGVVIGRIGANVNISNLPSYNGLLFYRSKETTFYNRNRRPIIIVNNMKYNHSIDIPVYKMDALS